MKEGPRNRWKELAEEFAANTRPHAGHFSWETDREAQEVGVLKEFEKALAGDGTDFFSQPRHRGTGNDPPDCEAISCTGEQVGIEITELVDPVSAKAARRGEPYDWKDWSHDLISTLNSILRNKDVPAELKGGPYSEYVLVIHTDEPWLDLVHIRQSLSNHIFPATSLVTRAYLLISYDPSEKGYPCIRLNIERT